MTKEEIENMTIYFTITRVEKVIKKLPTKAQAQMASLTNSTKHLKN